MMTREEAKAGMAVTEDRGYAGLVLRTRHLMAV
jgi:hypothetical protein